MTKILKIACVPSAADARGSGDGQDGKENRKGGLRPERRPPVAERRAWRKTTHGRVIDDPYNWLAAENWRDVLRDPKALPRDIAALLQAENDYCARVVAPLKALRETLVAELRGRIKEDDADVPDPTALSPITAAFARARNIRSIAARHATADPRPFCSTARRWRRAMSFSTSATPRIRPTTPSSPGASTTWVRSFTNPLPRPRRRQGPRRCGDGNGRIDRVERRFKRVLLCPRRREPSHRPGLPPRGRRRSGCRPPDHRRAGRRLFIGVEESRCRRFAIISVRGHDASESWLVDLRDASLPPRLVTKREPKLRYDVEPHGDLIYIHNNADGADDFRISVAPLSAPNAPTGATSLRTSPAR